jgi:hypothetical protein
MACPLAGCSAAPTVIATGQDRPSGLLVDRLGAYWTTAVHNPSMAQGSMPLATFAFHQLVACRLDGCAGSPTVLADPSDMLPQLAMDRDFIYWISNSAFPPPIDGPWPGDVLRMHKR